MRCIANRLRDAADRALLTKALGEIAFEVPEDLGILRADRDGRSPLDADPDGPAVLAIASIARSLAVSTV